MARPEPVVWDPTADPEEQAERMRAIALDGTRHLLERAAAIVAAGRHVTEVARTSRAALFAELAIERAAKEEALRERDQARAERDAAVADKGRSERS